MDRVDFLRSRTSSLRTNLLLYDSLLESQFQLSSNISIFKPILRQFKIVLCLIEIAVHRRHVQVLSNGVKLYENGPGGLSKVENF